MADTLQGLIGKPQIARLKALGSGLKVGQVLGARVLAIAVEPETELDRVEREGLIAFPKAVKKENTPLPTTGIVIALGPDIPCKVCGRGPWGVVSAAGELIHSLDGADYRKEGSFLHPYEAGLHEGDMIAFPKFAGSEHIINEESMRIMDFREVLCTLVDVRGEVAEVTQEATNLG